MDITAIIVTIISGLFTTLTTILVILPQIKSSRIKQEEKIDSMSTALTDLKKKVEEHNNFGLKIVELETKIKMLEKHN